MGQQIAGKKWGFVAIPRIGQEVIVDFLEGDPDRPLIVGSVYNAEQMPHYALPDEMTKSYIKTNSTKGGEGYNEFLFEDKKDEERLYLHAQKDMISAYAMTSRRAPTAITTGSSAGRKTAKREATCG